MESVANKISFARPSCNFVFKFGGGGGDNLNCYEK